MPSLDWWEIRTLDWWEIRMQDRIPCFPLLSIFLVSKISYQRTRNPTRSPRDWQHCLGERKDCLRPFNPPPSCRLWMRCLRRWRGVRGEILVDVVPAIRLRLNLFEGRRYYRGVQDKLFT